MARPKKQTVDYFPHFVKGGRTIFILENKFGNDGYAFWFKLLEILGESEGHFYDCSNASNWEYLLAKTRVTEGKAKDIINVLINLNKIDIELWNEHRVLWISNFVRNLSDVYRTRNTNLPSKPYFEDKKQPEQNVSSEKTQDEERFSAQETPKGEERKEKERKETPKGAKKTAARFSAPSVDEIKAYAQEKGYSINAEHFVDYYTSNGWKVGRNPMKDWRATVRTWASRDRAQNTAVQGTQRLGVGEFINNKGIRTYGTSGQPVPQDAPPRPSDAHYWSDNSQRWEKAL